MVKGTTVGTITDINGNYLLNVPNPEQAVLVFAFIGYDMLEIPVRGQSTINAVLSTSNIGLEEVVVTAMGITRDAKALSFARQSVSVEEMTEARSPNIVNSFSGKIAGVQVVPSGFNTGFFQDCDSGEQLPDRE